MSELEGVRDELEAMAERGDPLAVRAAAELDRLARRLGDVQHHSHIQRARLYRQGKAIERAWDLSRGIDGWGLYSGPCEAAHKALDAALVELEGDPPPNAPRRVLISCCGPKLDRPAPARELYTSDLFRKSVAYAERRGLPWSVLSARHGLVEADEELAPYQAKLSHFGAALRRSWGFQIVAQLIDRHPGLDSIIVLAGALYADALVGPFRRAYPDALVDLPLAGLQIGERLALLAADARRPVA